MLWNRFVALYYLTEMNVLFCITGLSEAVLQGGEADRQQQGVLQTLQSSQRFHQETGDLEGSSHCPRAPETVCNDAYTCVYLIM